MTEPIVLKIITDSTDAVTGIVDVKKATEALRAELKKLDEQLKNVGRFDAKGKTDLQVKYNGITKAITELEKPLDDAKKKQDDLNESQKKGATTAASMGKAFTEFAKKAGLVAAALALVNKVGQALIQTFKDTAKGMGTVTRAQTVWKQAIYELTQLGKGQSATFKELSEYSDRYIAFQLREADRIKKNAKLQSEYDAILVEASDHRKTEAQQADLYAKAEEKSKEIRDTKIAGLKEEQTLLLDEIRRKPELISLRLREAEISAQINLLDGENRRLRSQRSAREEAEYKKNLQVYYDFIEESLKAQEEYQKQSIDLIDKYNDARLEYMSGQEELDLLKENSDAEIELLRTQLSAVGRITAEQEKIFKYLGMNSMKAFYSGLSEEVKIEGNAIDRFIIPALMATIDPADLEGLQEPIVNTAENIKKKLEETAANEEFSFWNLLGLNPDEEGDQEMISAIEKSANAINDILNEALANRVAIAQRERELLDTKIAETQRSIELEQQLFEDGYANNLTSQKEYLKQLQEERDKALIEEEKAIKRQQLYDKITQTGSLLVSVAQILASATKLGLAGLALAPFAIATLWAIWGKAKSSTSKLAEGGSGSDTGIITGKRHSQGGERFLDHVEVERGEQWGVLSRPASEKYGKVFHDMVSSFNKDQMPSFMPISNSVRVENSGPNSRLDKVITEQKKLNQSLLKQPQIGFQGNKKVIRNGNKMRIVG